MASSRKRPVADRVVGAVRRQLAAHDLRGRRIVVGLSGGADSVVLLHALRAMRAEGGFRLAAMHVHHALSPNADDWAHSCATLCRRWRVPLTVRRVRVVKARLGLEAAARAARYAALLGTRATAVLLAHHLDDQAETVLFNLLRGTGLAGARGMPAVQRQAGRLVLRPLLDVPRAAIVAYARRHRLDWVEDESNANQALTRNFLRLCVAPLLAARFPRWREALARAARHFAAAELDANRLLRAFLAARGLRAPSERRLREMLRQLTSARADARVALRHDGVVLRVHRGRVSLTREEPQAPFAPVRWQGEKRLALPALGGELRFRRARGAGIDAERVAAGGWTVRLRSGGERLQPDPRRPRRTLKNLYQEAGVPAWQRVRQPLLFWQDDLVWAPGLGIEARFCAGANARGIVPQWHAGDEGETLRAPPLTPRSPRRATAGRAP